MSKHQKSKPQLEREARAQAAKDRASRELKAWIANMNTYDWLSALPPIVETPFDDENHLAGLCAAHGQVECNCGRSY